MFSMHIFRSSSYFMSYIGNMFAILMFSSLSELLPGLHPPKIYWRVLEFHNHAVLWTMVIKHWYTIFDAIVGVANTLFLQFQNWRSYCRKMLVFYSEGYTVWLIDSFSLVYIGISVCVCHVFLSVYISISCGLMLINHSTVFCRWSKSFIKDCGAYSWKEIVPNDIKQNKVEK